jgi:hypothetical protein
MPLTGRTTVTPDLKGCLEEVSRIAAGAGRVTATGRGPLEDITQPEPRTDKPKITAATAPKKGRHEKSTLGDPTQ